MLLYKHGLYVVGKRLVSVTDTDSIETGEVINLATERFVEAEWTRDASFVPPASFKLHDFVEDAFGAHVGRGDPQTVVIEFSKERAGYARARVWHRTQSFEEQRDGTVLLTFRCRSLEPIVSWVLEWGPHARVVEPPALAQQVARELKEALGHCA